MSLRHVSRLCIALALVALGAEFGGDQASAAQLGRTDVDEEVQVLTRGPVHEAFAETVTFDPEPGIVVPKAPPAAIEELPPDQKPEGANVAWIPGYWAWDDERSDFLWVSGVWRTPAARPPVGAWLLGQTAGQGYQWISGYWADRRGRRGGVPARAAGDRRGWPQHRRTVGRQHLAARLLGLAREPLRLASRLLGDVAAGLGLDPLPITSGPRAATSSSTATGTTRSTAAACCFAPVYFDAQRVLPAGYRYSPRMVIDLSVFTDHLFLRPRYDHYYFGDYYAANYRERRVLPWFSFQYRPSRLRSDLCAPALAASAGRRMGTAPTGGLRQPPRSREPATAAHVDESGRSRWGRRGFRRA